MTEDLDYIRKALESSTRKFCGEVNNQVTKQKLLEECNRLVYPDYCAVIDSKYEVDGFNAVWCHWSDGTVTLVSSFSSHNEARNWIEQQHYNVNVQIKENNIQ